MRGRNWEEKFFMELSSLRSAIEMSEDMRYAGQKMQRGVYLFHALPRHNDFI